MSSISQPPESFYHLVERGESRFWRWASGFWSIILFVAIIWDFVVNNGIGDIVTPIAAIYTAFLAIYSADKEFERWNKEYVGRHPGEVYVIIWTVIILGILLADLLFKKSYEMPPEIISTYIVVLGILAITKKSRDYSEHRKIEGF